MSDSVSQSHQPSFPVPSSSTQLPSWHDPQLHHTLPSDSASSDPSGIQPYTAKSNTSKRRALKSKQRDPNWVARPRNAYIIFRCWFVESLINQRLESGGSRGPCEKSLSLKSAQAWKDLPAEEKEYWKQKAQDEKTAHAALNPSYRYRPTRRRRTSTRESSSSSSSSSPPPCDTRRSSAAAPEHLFYDDMASTSRASTMSPTVYNSALGVLPAYQHLQPPSEAPSPMTQASSSVIDEDITWDDSVPSTAHMFMLSRGTKPSTDVGSSEGSDDDCSDAGSSGIVTAPLVPHCQPQQIPPISSDHMLANGQPQFSSMLTRFLAEQDAHPPASIDATTVQRVPEYPQIVTMQTHLAAASSSSSLADWDGSLSRPRPSRQQQGSALQLTNPAAPMASLPVHAQQQLHTTDTSSSIFSEISGSPSYYDVKSYMENDDSSSISSSIYGPQTPSPVLVGHSAGQVPWVQHQDGAQVATCYSRPVVPNQVPAYSHVSPWHHLHLSPSSSCPMPTPTPAAWSHA